MHIFLTGNKQVGKTTLIQSVLAELPKIKIGGFRTISHSDSMEKNLAVYLVPALDNRPSFEPNNCVGIRRPEFQAFPEIFDVQGVKVLENAEQSTLIIMDEVGKMEQRATAFCSRIQELLEQDTPVLGVLRKEGHTFLQEWIRSRQDIRLIEVTESNRDSLKEDLRFLLKKELNKKIPSAGAFTFRDGTKGKEVLMIQSSKGYGFPKGHIEPGESPKEAAVREVQEETGILIRIVGDKKWVIESAFPEEKRTITFYHAEPIGGIISPQLNEVADALWIPVEQACNLLRFPKDKDTFQLAVSEIFK